MKKRFINDTGTFILLIFAILGFVFFMSIRLCDDIADNIFGFVLYECIFGGFLLLGLITLFGCLEIIVISENEIKCKNAFKRTITILISDIQSIQRVSHHGNYAAIVENTWEIKDSQGKAIYILTIKKREKLIEQIKEKANLT